MARDLLCVQPVHAQDIAQAPELTPATKGRVLFVDDDPDLGQVVQKGLERRGFDVHVCSQAHQALEWVDQSPTDLVITDLRLDGTNGIDLSREVSDKSEIPVIVLTGYGDFDSAVGAIRAGVYDFLTKPVQLDALALAAERGVRHRRLTAEVRRLRDAVERSVHTGEILGESPAVRHLRDMVTRVSGSEVSVLVTGESGTGKELVARALHDGSPRKDGPFVALNCAAMPETLLESELFGVEKGAFTDAKAARPGLFQEADGGTIFFDEIAEMPLSMQAKLLRSLQEGRVRPLGGGREVPFDARVIAATNRDLSEEVEAGRFREDLYYRMNVVEIPVPPLRDRGSDILLLAHQFADRAAEAAGRRITGISEAAAKKLYAHDWSGNVRELQNCMERAVALAQGDEITVEDLPDKVRVGERTRVDPVRETAEILTVDELERIHIVRVLEHTKGNKTQAAKLLGFDRRTLYRKMERYGIGGRGKEVENRA